ncbi:MAG TPA: 16S rRNA (cytosine(967)-C(5))-methyltransferase RsmB [Gemmatimonadaceae bacterium]|nr:16S rRNA (cytosine(967)-C(5))-methyltransferase RsmB [Gemmatimonadaceae bacterium]
MARGSSPEPRSGGRRGGSGDDDGGVRTASPTAITDTRVIAAQICGDLRAGELLDAAFDRRTSRFDARDRRWTRELVYGSLRKRSILDAHLQARVKGGLGRIDADLVDLLRLGTYQLLMMGSVPAYAAIGQTVELAKRRHGIGASKLVNAVLRRLDRDREQLALPVTDDPVEAMALEQSHPQWLVARWAARWGLEETRRLLVANNFEAPLIARPVHVVREQLEASLEESGVHVEDAPLLRDSLVLAGPVASLAELSAFRKGQFHLQDPASTLVTIYAAIAPGSTVADVCAAPGGKAIELARTAGAVYASDLSYARLKRVHENIERLELSNIFPFVADARFAATRDVDAVLLDAPCTGTGTFRRHPDARWRLKPSDLAVSESLQRTLIRAVAQRVKVGGLLIYSTCSVETEENDAIVEGFLRENPAWRLEPPAAGVVPTTVMDGGYLRVLPQTHGADGAFAARLRRTA